MFSASFRAQIITEAGGSVFFEGGIFDAPKANLK